MNTLDDPSREEDDVTPSMYVSFQIPGRKDWRELANRRVALDYKRLTHEMLLPDDPAGLYVGYHVFPDQHDILFGERDLERFRIKWRLEALQLRDHYKLEVDGMIPFTAAIVHFPEDVPKFDGNETPDEIENRASKWKPDFGKAQRLIAANLDLSDFGTPQRWRWALRYLLLAYE